MQTFVCGHRIRMGCSTPNLHQFMAEVNPLPWSATAQLCDLYKWSVEKTTASGPSGSTAASRASLVTLWRRTARICSAPAGSPTASSTSPRTCCAVRDEERRHHLGDEGVQTGP